MIVFPRKQQGSPQSGVCGCVPPSIRGLWVTGRGRAGPAGAGQGREPKAIRVMSRILVLADSIRALDRPQSKVASISARYRLRLRPGATNASRRDRCAQASHLPGASLPSSPLTLKTCRRPSLSRQVRYRAGLVFAIQSSFLSGPAAGQRPRSHPRHHQNDHHNTHGNSRGAIKAGFGGGRAPDAAKSRRLPAPRRSVRRLAPGTFVR